MHRRAYLAGITGSLTSLGGCLSTVPLLGSPIASISVADTTGRSVEVAANLPRSKVTTARPAKIKLTWTNPTTDQISLALGKGRTMSNFLGEPETDGLPELELYPIGRPGTANRRTNKCWVRKPKDDGIEGGDATYDVHLSPGDSASRAYALWQNSVSDRCFPTGTYHVQPSIPPDRKKSESENWWRVTLDVTNNSE